MTSEERMVRGWIIGGEVLDYVFIMQALSVRDRFLAHFEHEQVNCFQ
jgi:hypothetical protein